jgi:uncharacterized protein (TIGR03084 family)
MAADLGGILVDLEAEQADLDAVVAALAAEDWASATPAEGWTTHDSIAHLAFFDERATVAATDPMRFSAELAAAMSDPGRFADGHLDHGRGLAPAVLLSRWREGREDLLAALSALDPSARLPWYGPSMSAASFATARLMETWCHGQDVVDALGQSRTPTPRLRHIAHLAVRARAFNYASHGRELPSEAVAVILSGPDGDTWAWGDVAAGRDRVRGTALDFALVTTQRRHLDDTDLVVEGPLASEWMAIAQTFAGPPGPGRRPGQFRQSTQPASA